MAISSQDIAGMRETLLWFHKKVATFQSNEGPDPKVGSTAATEAKEFERAESVASAWALGALLIEYGAEHLTAFVKTITEPVEVIACWTCVRSMLESCAMAKWLLDPDVDATTRVGRVFALRYQGMNQQLKYGRASRVSDAEVGRAKVQLDRIVESAHALGYISILNRDGRRIGLGCSMPSTTDMIEDNLSEGATYRLLSAVAHGHQWAITSLGFRKAEVATEVGGVSVIRFEKSFYLNGFAFLGLRTMCCLAIPLWAQCHYFGWNALRLEEVFENTADKLRLSTSVRFWRS